MAAQAIELSADALSNVKFIQEKKVIQQYFDEISQVPPSPFPLPPPPPPPPPLPLLAGSIACFGGPASAASAGVIRVRRGVGRSCFGAVFVRVCLLSLRICMQTCQSILYYVQRILSSRIRASRARGQFLWTAVPLAACLCVNQFILAACLCVNQFVHAIIRVHFVVRDAGKRRTRSFGAIVVRNRVDIEPACPPCVMQVRGVAQDTGKYCFGVEDTLVRGDCCAQPLGRLLCA